MPVRSRLKLVVWTSIILLVVLSSFFATEYGLLKLRVAFADGQVKVFEDMRKTANGTTDPRKLSGQLQYVLDYYPSGSKQVTGTRLDRVVEAARSNSIAAIIARLRVTTGKDLGNGARSWLSEYPPD
jgi:hypothetical protein